MPRVYGPGWGQEKRAGGRRLAVRCSGHRGFADCGQWLPPQDAAGGSPENTRRFRGCPRGLLFARRRRHGPRRAFSTDSQPSQRATSVR